MRKQIGLFFLRSRVLAQDAAGNDPFRRNDLRSLLAGPELG